MANFFITGATGAIGSFLVRELIQNGHMVTILIRANSDIEFTQKLQRLYDFLKLSPDLLESIVGVKGDITKKKMGIANQEDQNRCHLCDYVVHSAASINLNLDKESALSIILQGTKNVLDFFSGPIADKKINNFIFISTVGVGGREIRVLPEDISFECKKFHNNYEYAKYETEKFLWDEMQKKNIPLTICRPSMVVGDSLTGEIISFQIFYYLADFLSGKKGFGILPILSGRTLDTVNVDYLAKSLIEIALDKSSPGSVFNLCSGPQLSLSLSKLSDMVFIIYKRKFPRIKRLFLPSRFMTLILFPLQFLVARKLKIIIMLVIELLVYLKDHQVFTNVKTKEMLKKKGIRQGSLDESLEVILNYYLDQKYLMEKDEL